jgi:hypothetical protein
VTQAASNTVQAAGEFNEKRNRNNCSEFFEDESVAHATDKCCVCSANDVISG